MNSWTLATVVLAVFSVASAQGIADSRLDEVSVEGCLAAPGRSGRVVGSTSELYQAVRKGPGVQECVSRLDALRIDFEKYTLAGLTVGSGHCKRPEDLAASLRRDDEKMLLEAVVIFGPSRNPCRGLQHFDIWVLVPKRADYTISISDGRWIE